MHQVQVRSKCKETTPSGYVQYIYSDWVELFVATKAYIPDNCNDGDSSIISFDNIDFDKFNLKISGLNTEVLDLCGRRFLLRVKDMTTGIEEDHIVANTSFAITDLSSATTYKVFVRELFDGCGKDFYSACDWKGPFTVITKDKGTLCSGFTAGVRCVGIDYIKLTFSPISFIPGVLNSPNIEKNLRVKIRYRVQGTNPWTEVVVYKGNSYPIEFLQRGTTYEVQAALIKGDGSIVSCNYLQLGTFTTLMFPEADTDGDGIPDGCDDNPNDIVDDIPVNRNLPSLSCGVPGDTSMPDASQLRNSLYPNDIIMVRGLPILVLQAQGNQTFEGTGALVVPFSDKWITVRLNSIQVNLAGKVTAGSVTGVVETGFNQPAIELGYYTEEGENILDPYAPSYDDFCDPPPAEEFDNDGKYKNKDATKSDTNPKGFNSKKEYAKAPYDKGAANPQPYDKTRDPNCFDSDGIHLNGTKKDENGCSQEDYLDTTSMCYKNRKPPYSCIASYVNSKGPITEAGAKLVERIGESGLVNAMDCALTAEKGKVQDTLNTQITNCNKIRDTVNTNITVVKQDKKLTFGPGEEMMQRTMSSKFKEKPEPVQYGAERLEAQVALEDSHIRLYECDKKENALKSEEQLFVDKDKPVLKEQLKLELKSLLLRLPEAEAKVMDSLIALGNQTVLCEWMKVKVKEIIQKEGNKNSQYNGYGALDFERHPIKTFLSPDVIKFNRYSTDYGAIVSNNGDKHSNVLDAAKLELEQQRKEHAEIVAQLQSGAKTINGVDAAFYFEKIFNERELNQLFTDENTVALPIRISKNVLGVQYDVYICSLTATPTETVFDAFLILSTPPSKKRLVFNATGVRFGPHGFAEATLSLGNKVSLPISQVMRINLLPNHTSVKFDCNGFVGISINAELEICRKYLTPLDTSDRVLPEPAMVKATFQVNMPAWGEFIVNFSLDPFAVTGNTDMSWRVRNVWLDFSDSQSPTGITFPAIYQSPMMLGNTVSPLWKGVFIDTIEVRLSADFSSRNRTTIQVRKTIIDEGGLSAMAKVTPVLSLQDGRIGKWAFSIDTFKLAVCRNSFAGMGFMGKLELPLFDTIDRMNYTAIIERGGKYIFGVECATKLKIPMLKSGVLLSNTKIEIIKDDVGFYAKGILSGNLTIDADFGTTPFNLSKLQFANLTLSTRQPYFKPGVWTNLDTTSHGVNLGGFELNIAKIHPVEDTIGENRTGVGFDLKLMLGEGSNNLKVSSSMRILGKLEDRVDGTQKWVYDAFKVDAVCVDGSFPGVENIKGCIRFFEEDPLWGTGFYGKLSMGISAIGLDYVEVAGMFGKRKQENFKYFFLDGLAVLKTGIGTGFKLKAFGGGVYYHMSRDTTMSVLPTELNKPVPPDDAIGMSVTGIRYLPDDTRLIGINAIIGFTGDEERSYNGIANFWIDFNKGGGLNEIGIRGNMRMMAGFDHKLSPYATCDTCPVFGKVEIIYNHTAGTLDANMVLTVNAAKQSITGAAWAQIHIDKNDWWFWVGTPTQPCYVKFVLGSLNLARSEFYLDIGSKIPAMKALPSYVQDLVQLKTNDALATAKSGGGFMFGMNLKLGELDEKTFLIYYARLYVELGFDFCLKQFKNVTCEGFNDQIGMNGWYAMGQAYAYVKANIGIKVKLWTQTRKFNILEITAAAALQMQFPNPFWATGAVAGKFSVMGGLVKGNCKFKFELGEKCTPVDSSGQPIPQDLRVVESFYPEEGTKDLSPFDMPVVTFRLPYGISGENTSEYEKVIDQDDQGNDITARLESVQLELSRTNGPTIFLEEKDYRNWRNGGREFLVNPLGEPLAEGDYTLVVITNVGIFRNEPEEPEWDIQKDTLHFKVKSIGNFLPASLIKSAYPMLYQYNYYKKISNTYGMVNQGSIIVKKDITKFLQTSTKNYEVKFFNHSTGGLVATTVANFTVANSNGLLSTVISYQVPNDQLVLGQVYKLSLQERVASSFGAADPPKVIFDNYFRVSQYASLDAKLQALVTNVSVPALTPRDFVYRLSTGLSEPFDDYELDHAIILRSGLNEETSGLRDYGNGGESDFSTTLSRAMYTHFPKKNCPLQWKPYGKYTNMKEIDERTLTLFSNGDQPIILNKDNLLQVVNVPQYVQNSLVELAKKDFTYLKSLGSGCSTITRVNSSNSLGDTLFNQNASYPLPSMGSDITMDLIYQVPPIGPYGNAAIVRRIRLKVH